MNFSRDDDSCHRDDRALVAMIPIEYKVIWRATDLSIWAGPTYTDLDARQYDALDCSAKHLTSINHWGGIVGVNALLFDHAFAYVSMLWVDHPRPRAGLAYRF